MHLSKVLRVVLFIVFIFIGIIVWVNFWFFPGARQIVQRNEVYVMDIRTQVIEMDFPIRVLDNIYLQVYENPENLENLRLKDAGV